eukprot:CAMPEP_0113464194 /NCGR_PEP_ID=MMETSP0014_2-20120614/13071_1 /TAXON_ID=2857 /ORGANISM="Nitzschia sp." /LENGTH=320 /DNA_ID=CAMNT_0000356259 /DNA_START=800 /DNA_END=1762 /DNA_ORIENTATION=- /assembly_acc=CAM_ASM_000159
MSFSQIPSFLPAVFAALVLVLSASAHTPVSEAFQVQHLHHHPAYIKHAYGEHLHEQEHRQHHIRHDTNLEGITVVEVVEECCTHTEQQTSLTTLMTSQPSSSPTSRRVVMSLTADGSSSNVMAAATTTADVVSISTPVSYDEETGMVQTAVRAIVEHPSVSLLDNNMVGLSSTLVITVGALHEVVDCLELEWTHIHHAAAAAQAAAAAAAAAGGAGGGGAGMPTEGLAILSLGHFLHYGRETLKQLVEMHQHRQEEEQEQENDQDEQSGQPFADPAIADMTTTATITTTTTPVVTTTSTTRSKPRFLNSRRVPLLSKLRP